MKKVYNFFSGPAVLPRTAIEKSAQAVLNFKELGLSILEISHRSPEFVEVTAQAEKRLRQLLNIPDDYAVLFLGGGASLQFTMVPMNLLPQDGTADYADTGYWSSKALKEAKLFGKVNVVSTGKEKNYVSIPKKLNQTPGAAYLHITSNNTIFGTRYKSFPKAESVLVADMSSDILSRPVNVRDFGLIYAGAQKNMGPAGVTTVIIRKDLIGKSGRALPAMLDYKIHADGGSMYNTPPVFSIFVLSETLAWLQEKGGPAAMEKINERKAANLYRAIDESALFTGTCDKEDRSLMNVTFVMKAKKELEKEFLKGASERGFFGLEGHRSVGGFRASIYNAFPEEGVDALIGYLKEFDKVHR